MTWFVLSLFVVPIVLALVSALVIIWRRRPRRPRPPTFKELGDALERDIAAAEARGIHVDRTERMAPSRKRIKF